MSNFRVTLCLCFLDECVINADVQPLSFMTFSTNQMMVVVVRSGQFEKLCAIFKGDSLENAEAFKGFQVAVNGNQVRSGKIRAFANFLCASWAIEGEESAQNTFALFRHSTAVFFKALNDDVENVMFLIRHLLEVCLGGLIDQAFWLFGRLHLKIEGRGGLNFQGC